MIEEVNRTPAADKPVSELVSDLSDEVKRLVRDEFRLAAFELRDKKKRLGLSAGFLGMAGLLASFGAAALIAAAVLALALVMPGWLAAVLVGVALLLAAGLAALIGKKEVEQATPPLPEEATEGVREDVDAIKQGIRS